MDILLSFTLFVFSLLLYPFVVLAIKLEDGGLVFYPPERVGEGGRPIRIYKFRTMSTMDEGKQLGENKDRITAVGNILRKSRIDELPQLWNVLRGDLSLIGPRPEFPGLVKIYQTRKLRPWANERQI